ncbi:glycosyltransferase [Janibacter sp. LM]|uniref:glycosyltransferase n=1 Tax=Janibacter sp. LM TaxID=3144845 RepID=UPI0031F5FAC7
MRPSIELEVTPFRVLLGGYINVNVIDGSAFFLSGVAAMCSQYPGVEVTLVAANPVTRPEVLAEVLGRANVRLIDPYRSRLGLELGLSGSYMTRQSYGETLKAVYESEVFDAVLIRDNEAALEFLRVCPEAAERTSVYVTGVVSLVDDPDPAVVTALLELEQLGAQFCCQTPEMLGTLSHWGLGSVAERAFILPPHVPDADGEFTECYVARPDPTRLVYTGKFLRDWIPDRIIAGVKSAAAVDGSLHLDIAGDQFKEDPDNPLFVANVKYLLASSPHVTWHGRLARTEARELIRQADLGISWRSSRLSDSTELSTKVLEYGALAKPVIVNRTRMHEHMLGEDYPYFVDSSSEFRAALLGMRDHGDDLRVAAERCFTVSRPHWYSTVAPRLLAALGSRPLSADTGHSVLVTDLVRSVDTARPVLDPVVARMRGPWVDLVYDEQGAPAAAALLGACFAVSSWHAREAAATRWGYFTGAPVDVEPAPEVSADLLAVSARLASAEKQITRLQGDLEYTSRRLQNLRNSRLGQLQRNIWRMRGKGGQ